LKAPHHFKSIRVHTEAKMLVLTRKLNQEIIIGDDIRITVVAIGSDQVKLGITAPRSIPVHRSEIYRERQAMAHAAANGEREAPKV
jgi:carbon storage regulator